MSIPQMYISESYVYNGPVWLHYEPVKDDAHALVSPDANELVHLGEPVRGGEAHAIVDPGQVTQVEDIVELGGSGRQISHYCPGNEKISVVSFTKKVTHNLFFFFFVKKTIEYIFLT